MKEGVYIGVLGGAQYLVFCTSLICGRVAILMPEPKIHAEHLSCKFSFLFLNTEPTFVFCVVITVFLFVCGKLNLVKDCLGLCCMSITVDTMMIMIIILQWDY